MLVFGGSSVELLGGKAGLAEGSDKEWVFEGNI